MYYLRATEGENEELKKEGEMRISIFLSFTQYTLPTGRCTQNLKTLAPIGAEKSVRIFQQRERKIKGLISNTWLFFVTQYISSLSSLVTNFRIISQVVAEKSLT